jgi:DNA-binding PadR family transcriptional regulator
MQNDEQAIREISAMEFFILALIEKAGLQSVYELQKKAMLQPGGIRPALIRLESDGLLTRTGEGMRNKRELDLSALGRKFLDEKWWFSLQDYRDLESTLRALAVALLMNQVETARTYLRDASAHRMRLAKEFEDAASLSAQRTDPLSVYLWMKSICESRRRVTEAEALSSFRVHLKEERDDHQQ